MSVMGTITEEYEEKIEMLREELDRLKQEKSKLIEALKRCGIEANNALYFADSSDYKSALFGILWEAMPDKKDKGADELEYIEMKEVCGEENKLSCKLPKTHNCPIYIQPVDGCTKCEYGRDKEGNK